MTRKKRSRDALDIVEQLIGDDDELRQAIDEELVHSHVASMIYEARTAASLTQKQLAERVGTTQSVIARLESADYTGHSLSMLSRVAAALGRRVDVKLVAPRGKRRSA